VKELVLIRIGYINEDTRRSGVMTSYAPTPYSQQPWSHWE